MTLLTGDRLPSGSRLDPMLITDPLYRARLYSDMRSQTPYRAASYWTTYTVSPGERLLPELIAVRALGDESLKWVVMVCAQLDDPRREIESGSTLTLPSSEWLRDRIKYYQAMNELEMPASELVRIGTAKAVNLPDVPEPPTSSAGFEDDLNEVLMALYQPVPTVLPTDDLTEETLNKQAMDTQAKLDKIAQLLEKWRNV